MFTASAISGLPHQLIRLVQRVDKARSRPLPNGSASYQLHASYFLPWSAPNSLYSLLFPGMECMGEARGVITNRTELPWDMRRPPSVVKPGHLIWGHGATTRVQLRPGEWLKCYIARTQSACSRGTFWIIANKSHAEIGNGVHELPSWWNSARAFKGVQLFSLQQGPWVTHRLFLTHMSTCSLLLPQS